MNFSSEQARRLYRELDEQRSKWFDALSMGVSAVWPNVAANRDLDARTVVAVPPGWEGAGFGFEQLNGETTEAAVMRWQFTHVIKYVTERTTLDLDSVMGLFMAVLEPDPNNRWITALVPLRNKEPLTIETVAAVVAHFLLASGNPTPEMQVLRMHLESDMLPSLATHAAMAMQSVIERGE